ncbi:DUF1707 SHOCT-like domain-containing protein [Couchioplanes caeruleus]|uniref:DUF1707 domain-containing protein n=1 Tax=Couchioplanes caeruleus subsp. caeruleus TaxID=56427 RepID=A0A1K0GXG5_9ACTN|nr:DUF1707 domain-containing protein [Couchioplanes caeruleus]OJF14123.1 hypothetical protein BG844_11530 [Couchioplanes caeruleus subsp. caeruleus]
MRASDEDRQRIMAALERHTGAGRLTLDEFTQRVGVAADARTLDELAAVVSDLPAEEAEERQRREFLLLLAIAVVTLVLLGAFLGLR